MAGFFSVRNDEENTQYFSVQPTNNGTLCECGYSMFVFVRDRVFLRENVEYAADVWTKLAAPLSTALHRHRRRADREIALIFG
jgi:hypothetical protein